MALRVGHERIDGLLSICPESPASLSVSEALVSADATDTMMLSHGSSLRSYAAIACDGCLLKTQIVVFFLLFSALHRKLDAPPCFQDHSKHIRVGLNCSYNFMKNIKIKFFMDWYE
jgi:hypothetical protein